MSALKKFLKESAVTLLSLSGLTAPVISLMLVDFYDFSFFYGCAIGFVSFLVSFIIVMKRPDKEKQNLNAIERDS
jgi:Kef-type K+ transport system membrane component KefB